MEEYSDIGNETFDTCNTPHAVDTIPTTMQAPEHDQAQQIRHPDIDIEKN